MERIASGLDSAVYLDDTGGNTSIVKKYGDHISEDVLKRYHGIHNSLSIRRFGFPGDYNFTICDEIVKVSQISLKVLKLGDDIFIDNDGRLCSRVPFVGGETLFDACGFGCLDIDILNYAHQKRLSLMPGDDGIDSGMGFTGSATRLDPINIKVGDVCDRVLDLTITDLGSSIPFFTRYFSIRAEQLIS